MKDTIITAKTKKRELKILLVCFAIAVAINIFAIVKFDRGWEELFTQIGFVLAITIFFYVVATIVRLIVKLFCKNSQK